MNQNITFETGNKKLTEMVLWEDNPRTISKDEFEKLKTSIERKPYYMNARPIVLSDRTGKNVIIAGNQRYKAVKALGWTEAPTITFHCETEEQEVEIAMVDNHNNGEWDTEALANKFMDYPLSEWLGSDWDKMAGEFDKVDLEEIKEVTPEEPPEEPKSKLGEIYQLGDHRLMVGDSTKPDQVARLMDGELADLVVTDPPYNVNYGARGEQYQEIAKETGKDYAIGKENRTIMNDNMDDVSFQAFLTDAFKAMNQALRPGGAFYIWHASRTAREFENALNINGLTVREQLMWVKNTFTLGRQDYQWIHEPCWYGWKDGAGHYFIDDRSQSTAFDKQPNIEEMSKSELQEIVKKFYEMPATVIREPKPTKSAEHPTMKPVKLIARIIRNSSRERERVLDLFGGSGTTMIAAEQMNRTCYMMELDPRFADVIIDRWEKLTGEKARKLE